MAANLFFGTGAVIGALGLPATHPLVFALMREIGAGLILLGLSARFYQGETGTDEATITEIPYVLRALLRTTKE